MKSSFQTRIGLQILKIKLLEKVSDDTDDTLGQIVCILHKYKKTLVSKGKTDDGSGSRCSSFLSQIGSPFYTKSKAYISRFPACQIYYKILKEYERISW